MTYRKKTLLCTAAIAMAVTKYAPAFAFDEVRWEWNADVDEQVVIDVDVQAEFDPEGLTQVEKIQIQIGDVEAESLVYGIHNNQPALGGGATATVDETFTFTGTYDGAPPDNVENLPIAGIGGTDLNGNLVAGSVDENLDSFTFDVAVTGEVEVDPGEFSFDARTELPSIESSATAVGNNQSITSDVATLLHEGQFLFEDEDEGEVFVDPEEFKDALGSSTNKTAGLAAIGTVLAINGKIDEAEINANSEVYDILNARVDSSATAVGNNLTVDVNADGAFGDSLLIADLTQFSVADLSARSAVYDVSVNNYSYLGEANVSPLVGSTAAAIGNNVSINVGDIGDL